MALNRGGAARVIDWLLGPGHTTAGLGLRAGGAVRGPIPPATDAAAIWLSRLIGHLNQGAGQLEEGLLSGPRWLMRQSWLTTLSTYAAMLLTWLLVLSVVPAVYCYQMLTASTGNSSFSGNRWVSSAVWQLTKNSSPRPPSPARVICT